MEKELKELSSAINSYNDLFQSFEEFEKASGVLSKLKGRSFHVNISSVEFGNNEEQRPIHPAHCIDLGWSSDTGFFLDYYNTLNWNSLRLPIRSYMEKKDLMLALEKLPLLVEKITKELNETVAMTTNE